jgi:hypothetical protein
MTKYQNPLLLLAFICFTAVFYSFDFFNFMSKSQFSSKYLRAQQLNVTEHKEVYVAGENTDYEEVIRQSSESDVDEVKDDIDIKDEEKDGELGGAHKTRYDAGPLTHTHLSSKNIGTMESCGSLGGKLRFKHIVTKSAFELNWSNDQESTPWEVKNDRRVLVLPNNNKPGKTRKQRISHVLIHEEGSNETVAFDKEVFFTTDFRLNALEYQKEELQGDAPRAEDPRVIMYKGSPLVIYSNGRIKKMFLYDHRHRQTVMLSIHGQSIDETQKNWTPLIVGNKLLLVYSHDPLVILQYDVDAGDGVCTLIYGSLPIMEMNPPYGGTPFKEVTFSNPDEGKESSARIRSFLSVAHTRYLDDDDVVKSSDEVSRIYKPVPVLLHLVCPNNDNGDNDDSKLDGCEFTLDVFDLWHEVNSPKEVLESRFKKLYRKRFDVSYPYDIHVFQQNNTSTIRIGMQYEDCLAVYEDFHVDFDVIKNRQVFHSSRLKL